MRKNQRGIFIVEGLIMVAAFTVMVIALHKTETQRAEDLQVKTQQVQEQKQ